MTTNTKVGPQEPVKRVSNSNEPNNVHFRNIDEKHHSAEPIPIHIRLTFLRIGEIDTLNEKYQAQASIEARWSVALDTVLRTISREEQQRLTEGKAVSLIKYGESCWHPQLFIENALGELKDQITYSAQLSEDKNVVICEYHDIKGLFWEKLELYHFPSDVQELSISVGSMFYDDKVILMTDPIRTSRINREAFVDQQEWFLYEHVNTAQRFVKEFLVHNDNEDQLDEVVNTEERKRSFLVVSCHAARQSAYFYWNGFCLMFLITICGFCTFSIVPTLPQSRLQTAVTLLLTSITFRWTVNRSLPTISYLTAMDKYSITSIFILVILCIWHAVIGVVMFAAKHYPSVDTDDIFVWIDRYVFFIFTGIFLIVHVIMFIWLFSVPLAYRREMKQRDEDYRKQIGMKRKSLKLSKNNTHTIKEIKSDNRLRFPK